MRNQGVHQITRFTEGRMMSASCRNCIHYIGGAYGCKFTLTPDLCARYQADPEYVARVNAQAMEESQRRLQEDRDRRTAELQRQQEARLEEQRKQEEKRLRKEEARRRDAERRKNYEEINDEPYTPIAVRAALGILPHFFKK